MGVNKQKLKKRIKDKATVLNVYHIVGIFLFF